VVEFDDATLAAAGFLDEATTKPPLANLREFAYSLAELPVLLNPSDTHFKVCSEFCKNQNISYAPSHHKLNGITHHPVDGKVIREVATRRGLAAGIRTAVKASGCSQVKILDLWGNARTASYLNHASFDGIASPLEREARKGLWHLDTLSGLYDGKDLLRANGASLFEPCDVEKLGDYDVILVQDVQQHSTTKARIMALMAKTTSLVLVGHVESGPMGANGYHGFWFRQEDGSVLNWASKEDAPYVDQDDLTWVLADSVYVGPTYRVTWSVTPVYGNAVFVTFTKVYIDVPNCAVRWLPDATLEDIEVSNRYLHNFLRITCVTMWVPCVDSESVDTCGKNWLGYVERMAVWKKGVDFVDCQLSGATYGPGCDKQLEKRLFELMDADRHLAVLRTHRHDLYHKLQIATAAHARQLSVRRSWEIARLSAGSAGMIAQTREWRNLEGSSAAFDRCGTKCCATVFGCVCCVVSYYACSAARRLVPPLGCCVVAPPVILEALPRSTMPESFLHSIHTKADIASIGDSSAVMRIQGETGVVKLPKRYLTQTPSPTQLRLGPEGKVQTQTAKGKVVDGIHPELLSPTDPGEYVYAYGPNYVPWHANQNGVGGGVGMVNAILTPVTLPDGRVLSAEESAIMGQRLHRNTRFTIRNTVDREVKAPIHCTDPDRIAWAERHVKRSDYLPVIKRLVDQGAKPYLGRLNIKCKNNELLMKDKERVIISAEPDMVCYFGPEAEELTLRFKHYFSLARFDTPCYTVGYDGYSICGHFVWGSGTTPEERGEWFDRSLLLGDNHFSLTVCGDDVAAIVMVNGQAYAVESDAKNWDHSQIEMEVAGERLGMLSIGHHYYREFGASEEHIGALRGQGKLAWKPDRTSGQAILVDLGYSRRYSGLDDTTDGNTLVMADLASHCISSAMVEAKDCVADLVPSLLARVISEVAAQFGAHFKVKVHADVRHLTFLKGFYVDCAVGPAVTSGCCRARSVERKTIWYPSPEILTKIGWSTENPANQPSYRDIHNKHRHSDPTVACALRAYDIVNAWKTFTGLPVLGEFQRMVKSPIATNDAESYARYQTFEKYDKPVLMTAVHDQDWEPMLEVLGIRDDLDSFSKLCENIVWKPGMFVQHRLLKTLAARYA